MSTVRHLFRHHRWANLALVDAIATLPGEVLGLTSPGGYGTVHETLVHLVENERRYVATLRGATTIVAGREAPDVLAGLGELRNELDGLGSELIAIAAEMSGGATVSGTFNGRPFEMPAFIPLLQAYNHGTEHRTNITTTLASHGHEAPPLDVWSFLAAGMP